MELTSFVTIVRGGGQTHGTHDVCSHSLGNKRMGLTTCVPIVWGTNAWGSLHLDPTERGNKRRVLTTFVPRAWGTNARNSRHLFPEHDRDHDDDRDDGDGDADDDDAVDHHDHDHDDDP